MHVWWGPELIYVYNDAHIPVLGKRHPHALEPTRGRGLGPAVATAGTQVEAVMLRGESTWNEQAFVVLEQHGFREDAMVYAVVQPTPAMKRVESTG